IGTETLETRIDEEVSAEQRVMALVRERSPEFLEALRVDLFLDALALKRVAVRSASLAELAARASQAPCTPEELRDAMNKVCQLLDTRDRSEALRVLAWWGRSKRHLDGFLERLAQARRATRELEVSARRASRLPVKGVLRLLKSRRKVAGERRFCTP